jgi:tetratricopeptide (TPR) repeat protein
MGLVWGGILVSGLVFAQEHAAVSFSPDDKVKKAKEYYLSGEKYLQEGNYILADEELKKAQDLLGGLPARTAPLAPASLTAEEAPLSSARRAWLLSQKGQSKDAIVLYLRAIEIEPQNSDLYYNLAIEYLKTKQFSQAVGMFLKSLSLNPNQPDACYNLGVIYEERLKDNKKAIEYYQKYLKCAPVAEDINEVKSWVGRLQAMRD